MASRAKEGNINMLEISQKKKSKEYHFIVKTKSYAQVLGCMDLAASALIACIVINQQSSTTYGATKIEESINMLILVSSRHVHAILNKDGKTTFYYTGELLAYMEKTKNFVTDIFDFTTTIGTVVMATNDFKYGQLHHHQLRRSRQRHRPRLLHRLLLTRRRATITAQLQPTVFAARHAYTSAPSQPIKKLSVLFQ
jgi:hypothetical protein